MKKIVSLILALTLMLGACLTLASCGAADYTVGICQIAPHVALDAATQGFMDALTEELAKEGKTVKFKNKNANNDGSACTTIIGSFVSSNVDLILANATPVLQAASTATKTIPVLGTSITEYGVALGIENFNGVVGGNVSGTSDLAPLTEQAQMMVDILKLQAGDKVGLIYCSSEANSVYQVTVVAAYLSALGIVCTPYSFSDSNDLQTVCAKAAAASKALYVPTDNTAADNTGIINNICSAAKVPVFAGEEGICAGCGFATLSISYYNIGKKTGEMAAKILLGKEDISKMEIQYDANPVKKYNKEICDNLGIDTAELDKLGYVAIESGK